MSLCYSALSDKTIINDMTLYEPSEYEKQRAPVFKDRTIMLEHTIDHCPENIHQSQRNRYLQPNEYATSHARFEEQDDTLKPDSSLGAVLSQQGGLEHLRFVPKTANELRTMNNQRTTYNGTVVRGVSSVESRTKEHAYVKADLPHFTDSRPFSEDTAFPQRTELVQDAFSLPGAFSTTPTNRNMIEDKQSISNVRMDSALRAPQIYDPTVRSAAELEALPTLNAQGGQCNLVSYPTVDATSRGNMQQHSLGITTSTTQSDPLRMPMAADLTNRSQISTETFGNTFGQSNYSIYSTPTTPSTNRVQTTTQVSGNMFKHGAAANSSINAPAITNRTLDENNAFGARIGTMPIPALPGFHGKEEPVLNNRNTTNNFHETTQLNTGQIGTSVAHMKALPTARNTMETNQHGIGNTSASGAGQTTINDIKNPEANNRQISEKNLFSGEVSAPVSDMNAGLVSFEVNPTHKDAALYDYGGNPGKDFHQINRDGAYAMQVTNSKQFVTHTSYTRGRSGTQLNFVAPSVDVKKNNLVNSTRCLLPQV